MLRRLSSSSHLTRWCQRFAVARAASLLPSGAMTACNVSAVRSVNVTPAVQKPSATAVESSSSESSLALCEKNIPLGIDAVLKSAEAAKKRTMPLCGWGYLFRVSHFFQGLVDDAIVLRTEEERAPVSDLRKQFRPEFELIEGATGVMLKQLLDAASLYAEGKACDDDSLCALATEDMERLVAEFDMADANAVLDHIVDAADEYTQLSKKWTIETLGRAGGEEAAIFAREMRDMYANYCRTTHGWEVEDISEPDQGGGTLRVIGNDVFKFLKHEIGVHRVQRVPTTEASGRLQTSTVSVFLLPQPDAVSLNVDPNDIEIEMTRGGGPGGQGVNSSSNCCRLFHKPSNTHIRCHYHRSGNANREMAMDILMSKLWAKHHQETQKASDDIFSKQFTSGERGERMRTYNFPQNRITDHRFKNFNCSAAAAFMTGVGPLLELHEMANSSTRDKMMREALDKRFVLMRDKVASIPVMASKVD